MRLLPGCETDTDSNCRSNRSAVFLKLGEDELVVEDCSEVLEAEPQVCLPIGGRNLNGSIPVPRDSTAWKTSRAVAAAL